MSAVFDALIAVANRTGRPVPEVLRHHFLEAALRRLSAEPQPLWVLRGSMITRLWAAPFPRPAGDLDFLGTVRLPPQEVLLHFTALLGVDHDDGVTFETRSFSAKGIWEDSEFPGVRLTLRADALGEEQVTTVDVGFGDPLVPPAEWVDYPLMTGDRVPVWAVHPATLIGWKLHGLAEWGRLRWRPKDVLDLWLLTGKFALPADTLAEAIRVAFTSRGYGAADARRTIEDPGRWGTFAAQARWSDFRREHPDAPIPESVAGVVSDVAARLRPALDLLPA